MNGLAIVPLIVTDAEALFHLLTSDDKEYSKYFHPFSFSLESLTNVLSRLQADRFWGVYYDDVLIAFFMLRGLDAGFTVPSYGVYVSEKYSGKGISRLTLQFVESWCRLNSVSKVMIKVHPENFLAKRNYELFGAVFSTIDPDNGNLIYFRSVS